MVGVTKSCNFDMGLVSLEDLRTSGMEGWKVGKSTLGIGKDGSFEMNAPEGISDDFKHTSGTDGRPVGISTSGEREEVDASEGITDD